MNEVNIVLIQFLSLGNYNDKVRRQRWEIWVKGIQNLSLLPWQLQLFYNCINPANHLAIAWQIVSFPVFLLQHEVPENHTHAYVCVFVCLCACVRNQGQMLGQHWGRGRAGQSDSSAFTDATEFRSVNEPGRGHYIRKLAIPSRLMWLLICTLNQQMMNLP